MTGNTESNESSNFSQESWALWLYRGQRMLQSSIPHPSGNTFINKKYVVKMKGFVTMPFAFLCARAVDRKMADCRSNYFFTDRTHAVHCCIEDSSHEHDRFVPMFVFAELSTFGEHLSEYLTTVINEAISPITRQYKDEIFNVLLDQPKLYPILYQCMFVFYQNAIICIHCFYRSFNI